MFALSIPLYVDKNSFNFFSNPFRSLANSGKSSIRTHKHSHTHKILQIQCCRIVRATRKAVSKKRNKKIEHEKYARKYSGKMFLSL